MDLNSQIINYTGMITIRKHKIPETQNKITESKIKLNELITEYDNKKNANFDINIDGINIRVNNMESLEPISEKQTLQSLLHNSFYYQHMKNKFY